LMWYQVGSPWMFEGKMFFPCTGMPILKNERSSARFAVWLPVPFAVATAIEKSLTLAVDSVPTRGPDSGSLTPIPVRAPPRGRRTRPPGAWSAPASRAAGRRRHRAPAPPSSRHSTAQPRALRGGSRHKGRPLRGRGPSGASRTRMPVGRYGRSGLQHVLLVVAGAGRELHGAGPLQALVHALLDLLDQVWSGVEELHRLLLALAEPDLTEAEPRAGLLHHVQVRRHLHQVTQAVD